MAVFLKKVFKPSKAQKQREAARSNPSNEESLTELLGSYASNFKIDPESLWFQHDQDQNGMLDREECKAFMADLSKYISADRARNYNANKFYELFEKYDEDQNGFVEKSEMCVFIKKVFANRYR